MLRAVACQGRLAGSLGVVEVALLGVKVKVDAQTACVSLTRLDTLIVVRQILLQVTAWQVRVR